MGICKQLHLLKVFQVYQTKSVLYLGTQGRESLDDPKVSQENAGLTQETENTLPSFYSRPTPHAVLEHVLKGKPGSRL